MLNMVNLIFTKVSSSEDRSDSYFEKGNIPQGDDGFLKNLWLNLTQEMSSFFEFLVGVWMSLLCLLCSLSKSTDQRIGFRSLCVLSLVS